MAWIGGCARLRRVFQQLSGNPGIAYLAEVFAVGRELTVGVIELVDGTLRARCRRRRYLGVGTREITPAVAEPAVIDAAQALALRAHRALGCAGYTRTDMIVTERGPVFLETNTLPGLTQASFLPQQLAVIDIELLDLHLANVARAVALSPSRFSHLFTAHFGVTWTAYRNWRRLLTASAALCQKAASITEVALRLGYSSHAHLTAAFRTGFGLTPTQLRALHPHVHLPKRSL